MGYTYDIALLLRASAKDKLWGQIGIAGDDISDLFSVQGYDSQLIDIDAGDILYEWWFYKLSFEEQEFFDQLDSVLKFDDFRLIKLGEELSDIETQGCYCSSSFDLKLTREIKFNSPGLAS